MKQKHDVYAIHTNGNDEAWIGSTVAALSCGGGKPGQGYQAVVYCLQGNGVDRADTAGCNGRGWTEDVSYTLNTIDKHVVAYGIDCQGGKGTANYSEDVMPTLLSDSHGTPHAVAYASTDTKHMKNVYPINTMVATRGGRDDMRTCFGIGEAGDPQFTISAAHGHAVCYESVGCDLYNGSITGDRAATLNANTGVSANHARPSILCTQVTAHTEGRHNSKADVYAVDCRNATVDSDRTCTLQAKSNGGRSLNCMPVLIYDARGNGDGKTSPTLTGDHQDRITDYTALLVSKKPDSGGSEKAR